MRRIALCFTAILLLQISAYAQDFKARNPEIAVQPAIKALPIKEELRYSVEWLGFPVGKIVIKVAGVENVSGYPCYRINAQAFPNSFMKHIYDIAYTVDTFIDKKMLFSRRFSKIRRINDSINEVIIDFDQEKGEASFFAQGSNIRFKLSPSRDELDKENLPTTSIPYGTQDLLSALYYFRFQEIKEGAKYSVNIYYNQRNWNMVFVLKKPFKKEIRKLGIFDVVEVSPDAALNDYILGKRKFSVFFTTDYRRIPVMFVLNTALGPMRGIIENISGENG